MVLALMRTYNDSPPNHTIAITRDGTISAGPQPLPFSIWQCLPDQRRGAATLTFESARQVLTALQASGAFGPH
jgi:hypothetical protein